MRTVTVNANSIALPDGNLYNEGDTATLTDAQYARISPAMFEGDTPLLSETTTGHLPADDNGNADLTSVSDQQVRTISEYEDYEAGWKLILQPPGPGAPAIRVLVAAQSNINSFGFDLRDSEDSNLPYMMDSNVASNLSSTSTLLMTFDPVQGYGDNWFYAVTAIPLPNVD